MLIAGVVGACATSAPIAPRGIAPTVTPTVATTLALFLRSSPTLVLGNAAAPPSAHTGALQKTVDDAQMQALLDTFAVEGTFNFGIATQPPGGKQLLMLSHGDRQWFWAPGSAGEARTTAFVLSRSHFLELFNNAAAYVPADISAERDLLDSARRAGARNQDALEKRQ